MKYALFWVSCFREALFLRYFFATINNNKVMYFKVKVKKLLWITSTVIFLKSLNI